MLTAADRLNWLIRHGVCTAQHSALDETRCPSCGHAVAVHVGAECCAVCEIRAELADLRIERARDDG